jgi:TPR repeat protein
MSGKGNKIENELRLGVALVLEGNYRAGLSRLYSELGAGDVRFRIAFAMAIQPIVWAYAFDLLKSASEEGNADAMAFLGIGKASGALGMPSGQYAAKWLEISRARGNVMGMAGYSLR